MDWFLWLTVGWWAFAAILTVTQVGKQRKPLEPGAAAITVVICGALIAGMLVTR